MSGGDDERLAQWLRAGIAGDEKAYARFLDGAAALIRRFAVRRTAGGGVDPEDIVQETLLAIHTKRHTWRTDAPVLPWVFAIARFKLIDAYRRRGRRAEIEIDEVADSLAQPAEEAVPARDIARALDGLTPGQRAVVSAIAVDGNSIAQTAARQNLSEGAVRVAFHRGLAAITRRFGGEGG